jgi:hypothetical protein
MIVESSRLACPSSRQSNPPQPRAPLLHACFVLCQSDGSDAPISRIQPPGLASSLGPWPSDGCDAPIFRIQPSGLASSTRIFGSFAQATAVMHRSSKSNRQDWLLLRASLGPLPKRRLRCTDIPNATVRIGFHQHLWVLGQATAVMHQSAYQTQPPGLSCIFLVLDQATAPMHQSPQTQRPRIGFFDYTLASFGPCQSDGWDAPILPQPTARMYARVTMDRLFTYCTVCIEDGKLIFTPRV